MNTRSFERQMQQLAGPAPDPAARERARLAALEEFGRVHSPKQQQSRVRGWSLPRLWLGGFATACVVVVSVSVAWLTPQHELQPVPPAQTAGTDAVPTTGQTSPPAGALVVERAAEPGSNGAESDEPPARETPAGAARATPVAPPRTVVVTAVSSESGVTSQPSQEQEQEISVTGTRIQVPAPPVTPPGPVTTITGEEIRHLGTVNVADSLSDPQTRAESFIGNTIANLRGLDPAFGTRTLTLIDGRRQVAGVGQASLPRSSADGRGDQFDSFTANPVKRTADEPVSTFSIDVDTASYSYARRMLNSGSLPAPDAVRVEEMINYFDYDWPAARSRSEPFRPTVTVSDSPWGAGRKLVHVGIKGYEVPTRRRPDVNLVMLVDVSGSMNAPDRLPLAKLSMKLLLDSLRPSDTVAIAVYAGAAGEVLAPTPVRERGRIEAAIDSLRPYGSTAGAQGIQLAYQLARRGFRDDGVNRILLATDGDFNVGVSDPTQLRRLVERERENGVHLSVLGFGQGNYRDDVAQTLAQNGNGVAAYIDTAEEARKVLVQQAGASLVTIAADVKIQVEFNPATVAEYRLVGYETRALQRQDFNNDRVDAGEVGSGHTVTAIYEITPVDSAARQIDEPRYATQAPARDATRARPDEYGFVKVRYKLPGENTSKLLEQPIRTDAGVPSRLRNDVAFSTAVAGFAQLLRGGDHTGALTWDDVINQAGDAIGADPYGYRAAFVELCRRARALERGSRTVPIF